MERTSPVVLLVDDDVDSLDMYETGLPFDGFRPVTMRVASGLAAQMSRERPDVVVTDTRLFEDDQELLDIHHLHIPIVVLTAHTDASIYRRAHEWGCAAVVTKPCTPDSLASILRMVIHSQR
jgi:DNA-binding NtrC family response regulator